MASDHFLTMILNVPEIANDCYGDPSNKSMLQGFNLVSDEHIKVKDTQSAARTLKKFTVIIMDTGEEPKFRRRLSIQRQWLGWAKEILRHTFNSYVKTSRSVRQFVRLKASMCDLIMLVRLLIADNQVGDVLLRGA